MLDDSDVLFTALSVALESMMAVIDKNPKRLELGFARAACVDARKELDAFLDDHDMAHIMRGNEIMQTANKQLVRWGHHV